MEGERNNKLKSFQNAVNFLTSVGILVYGSYRIFKEIKNEN